MEKKYQVFFIMPFQDDFLALFEKLKEEFQDQYDFINAGDLDNQQNIIKDIVIGIYKSDIIIADLTGLNANVFYELGLAHAMNKKVIIITQDILDLPFDIKPYRANQYGMKFNEVPLLIDKLNQLLQDAVDGSKEFGNPVSDFIPDYFSKINLNSDVYDGKILSEESTNIDFEHGNDKEKQSYNIEKSTCASLNTMTEEDDLDDGYLDLIVKINENADKITSEIELIGSEMTEMSVSVNKASEAISSSNNSDINYARKICRNLADPVDLFSKKLEVHISNISTSWDNVEYAYLNLLDNHYAVNKSNSKDLLKSIDSLEDLQHEISNSDKHIVSFVSVMQQSKGVERRLTKAINTLTNEFDKYLTMTDSLMSSIDRMISKSNIVIESLLKEI